MSDETVNDSTSVNPSAADTAPAPEAAEQPKKKAPAKKAATKKTAAKKAAASAPTADSADETAAPVVKKTTRTRKSTATKSSAKKASAAAVEGDSATETLPLEGVDAPKAAPAKRTRKAPASRKSAAPAPQPSADSAADPAAGAVEPAASTDASAASTAEPAMTSDTVTPLFQAPVVTTRTRKRAAPKAQAAPEDAAPAEGETSSETGDNAAEGSPASDQASTPAKRTRTRSGSTAQKAAAKKTAAKKATAKKTAVSAAEVTEDDELDPLLEGAGDPEELDAPAQSSDAAEDSGEDEPEAQEASEEGDSTPTRRRRRRGGRRRRRSSDADSAESTDEDEDADSEAADSEAGADEPDDADAAGDGEDAGATTSSRRRRRRRRAGDDDNDVSDDPENTVTRVRSRRAAEDQITAVSGSTRLEAKKQRRREGREAGRRRAPIVSEAEFLARRESVDRVMAIRQRNDLTQIAVLEDKVLVEHYVARESQASLIGNVYLGKVQNVLPSMEAAFVDIGKGRNAVLYAGEVNWTALGHKEGTPRKIEAVLSAGQKVLVQVTKDPVGHKGARLTSQISLAGRFLVYVPDGTTSGISRKLPDTERNRLKNLLKEIVPETAGVIVRTAAEGASEAELTRDVERLKARWDDIERKATGNAPQLLYGEPDLMLKVVRDLFTEDFSRLVIDGEQAWDTVHGYITHVAPDLAERLERFEPDASGRDVFGSFRIDEQIHKGLDRKVWLPSGGSLVIDRTEAMTVVDVNTGKFTGSGGNLEETVTKNNLEAAEEIVRQLRLRDIGGIIVIDFIDMVLESNRDLVVRRLVECLGRDRTRHQVAEVTSLGLVQMTRKRIGTGLLEAFSSDCEHCQGRGVLVHAAPVESKGGEDDSARRGRRQRGRGKQSSADQPAPAAAGASGTAQEPVATTPSPSEIAAMARAAAEAEAAPQTEPQPEPQPEHQLDDTEAAPEPAAEPAAEPTAEPTAESTKVDQSAEPVEAPATDGAATPIEADEPAAPADVDESTPTSGVVTRTRRRSATRPAGPPPVTEAPAMVAPPTTPEVEPPPAPVVTHVPVKKRGSRKR